MTSLIVLVVVTSILLSLLQRYFAYSFSNRFCQDEFLLSGPGSLGIFVNANGQSERPPLTLSTNLLGLFVREELVFAVDDEFVSIHW